MQDVLSLLVRDARAVLAPVACADPPAVPHQALRLRADANVVGRRARGPRHAHRCVPIALAVEHDDVRHPPVEGG
eukprot:11174779-Lingulodinium_polyedra.AAC.1